MWRKKWENRTASLSRWEKWRVYKMEVTKDDRWKTGGKDEPHTLDRSQSLFLRKEKWEMGVTPNSETKKKPKWSNYDGVYTALCFLSWRWSTWLLTKVPPHNIEGEGENEELARKPSLVCFKKKTNKQKDKRRERALVLSFASAPAKRTTYTVRRARQGKEAVE